MLNILFSISGCGPKIEPNTDWATLDIKGRVKILKENSFEAVTTDGKIEKGRSTGVYWSNDTYYIFNKIGHIVQKATFRYSGTLLYQSDYVYDSLWRNIRITSINADNSLKSVKLYKYDDKGRISQEDTYLPKYEHPTKWTFKYDKHDNKIEENRYFPDNGKLSVKVFYKYNSKGKKTEEYMYNSEGNQIARWVSRYNSDGLKIEEDYFNALDSLVAHETYKYEFDEKGNWVRQYIFDNGEPTYIIDRRLTYFE